jgi:hypothetical protein
MFAGHDPRLECYQDLMAAEVHRPDDEKGLHGDHALVLMHVHALVAVPVSLTGNLG